MTPIKLKKAHWTKKRYITSDRFLSYFQWFEMFKELNSKISSDSFYQKVERSCHLEYNVKTLEFRVMAEVTGVLNESFSHLHIVEGDVLILDLSKDYFESDFDEVLSVATNILAKLGAQMAPVFHLVIDQDKLALHFFNQKDYSQF